MAMSAMCLFWMGCSSTRVLNNPSYMIDLYKSGGLAPMKTEGMCGFLDFQGNIVIQPQFEEVNDFEEDMAAVKVGDKWGFVDKTGKMVVMPRYD